MASLEGMVQRPCCRVGSTPTPAEPCLPSPLLWRWRPNLEAHPGPICCALTMPLRSLTRPSRPSLTTATFLPKSWEKMGRAAFEVTTIAQNQMGLRLRQKKVDPVLHVFTEPTQHLGSPPLPWWWLQAIKMR